jgi:hypothetical protein
LPNSKTSSEDAGQLCAGYSHGGYDDWRLPDKNELKEILNILHGMSDEYKGVAHWPSSLSEGSTGYAWGIEWVVKKGSSKDSSDGGSSRTAQPPATYSTSREFWAWPVREF